MINSDTQLQNDQMNRYESKLNLFNNFYFFTIEPTRSTNFTNLFSYQNKFVKLVHLVGFIVKESVTMHGHMNIVFFFACVCVTPQRTLHVAGQVKRQQK